LLVKIKRDLENQVCGLLKNLGLVIGQSRHFALRKNSVPFHRLRRNPMALRCGERAPITTSKMEVGHASVIHPKSA
jgi:hypothetical protein